MAHSIRRGNVEPEGRLPKNRNRRSDPSRDAPQSGARSGSERARPLPESAAAPEDRAAPGTEAPRGTVLAHILRTRSPVETYSTQKKPKKGQQEEQPQVFGSIKVHGIISSSQEEALSFAAACRFSSYPATAPSRLLSGRSPLLELGQKLIHVLVVVFGIP